MTCCHSLEIYAQTIARRRSWQNLFAVRSSLDLATVGKECTVYYVKVRCLDCAKEFIYSMKVDPSGKLSYWRVKNLKEDSIVKLKFHAINPRPLDLSSLC